MMPGCLGLAGSQDLGAKGLQARGQVAQAQVQPTSLLELGLEAGALLLGMRAGLLPGGQGGPGLQAACSREAGSARSRAVPPSLRLGSSAWSDSRPSRFYRLRKQLLAQERLLRASEPDPPPGRLPELPEFSQPMMPQISASAWRSESLAAWISAAAGQPSCRAAPPPSRRIAPVRPQAGQLGSPELRARGRRERRSRGRCRSSSQARRSSQSLQEGGESLGQQHRTAELGKGQAQAPGDLGQSLGAPMVPRGSPEEGRPGSPPDPGASRRPFRRPDAPPSRPIARRPDPRNPPRWA